MPSGTSSWWKRARGKAPRCLPNWAPKKPTPPRAKMRKKRSKQPWRRPGAASAPAVSGRCCTPPSNIRTGTKWRRAVWLAAIAPWFARPVSALPSKTSAAWMAARPSDGASGTPVSPKTFPISTAAACACRRPDAGTIEFRLEGTQQFGFVFEGRRFAGTELKFDAGHFPQHPQMTPGHPVGVGNPIIAQALLKIFGFPDVKHIVGGISHQIHARSLGSVAKKSLPQPLVKRPRIRNQEHLAHAGKGLIEIEVQCQPNRQ